MARVLPRSVRGRAVVGAGVAMVLFGLVVGVASFVLVTSLARTSLADLLGARLADAAAVMEVAADGGVHDLGVGGGADGVFLQVRDAGTVVGSTSGLAGVDICDGRGPDSGTDTATFTIGGTATTYLRLVQGAGERRLCAIVSLEPVERAQSAVIATLALVLPLVVAGVCGVVWFAVGRALAGVDDLRRQAEAQEESESASLRVQPTGDEVERMGTTLNRLLVHLSQQSATTRQFVADAGHELRSPLAALRVTMEFGADAPEAELRASVVDALADVDRLERLVTDLLALARADSGRPAAPRPVALDDVVRVAVDATRRAHPDLVVDCRLAAAVVLGTGGGLRSLVTNLLDNAARHAVDRVDVTLDVDDGVALLRVDDDGAGLAPADCERIFDRFVRLDDARVRDEGGSGLGLAIVASVAAGHGGSSWAEPGPGGHVVVRLPCAPS